MQPSCRRELEVLEGIRAEGGCQCVSVQGRRCWKRWSNGKADDHSVMLAIDDTTIFTFSTRAMDTSFSCHASKVFGGDHEWRHDNHDEALWAESSLTSIDVI